MGKADAPGVGHPGVGAGYPGADVQNRADFVLQEPDVRPDGPDVRPVARMSGATIPDRDLDFESRFWAEMDDFRGKIEEILWMKVGEKMGES
jgi:hypothetical protein